MTEYIVTGVYAYTNRHFKAIKTDNRLYAFSINLWKGSVWEVSGGKRKLIKRVYPLE